MIIAERTLNLDYGDRKIGISLSLPELDDGSWFCTYAIQWPDGERSVKVGGVDSMQALVCAMQLLGAEIYASNYHKAGRLSLEGQSGYGIPVPRHFRADLVGDDAKYL
jgi:hypothetical protein